MASRVAYCLPIFFGPPLAMAAYRYIGILKPNSSVLYTNALDIFNITIGLLVAMPLNCAVFP